MKFSTLASASHLSPADRRAYLKAMEIEERKEREAEARRARLNPSTKWVSR